MNNPAIIDDDAYYDRMAAEANEAKIAISCYEDKLDKEVEELLYLQDH